MGRVAVLGDIGGQFDVFRDAVASIGGSPDHAIIPSDTQLIQVGDVVRRHDSADLDSIACAAYADRLMRNNPGRYIQVMGNHEMPSLGGQVDPHWTLLSIDSADALIRQWWEKRDVYLAAGIIHSDGRETLITHAGMNANYHSALGGHGMVDTVQKLNGMVGGRLDAFERPGYLVKKDYDRGADFLWSLVGVELYETWYGKTMPFEQIHGHCCSYRWDVRDFWADIPDRARLDAVINEDQRYITTTDSEGNTFRTVDWVLGNKTETQRWEVLIVDDCEVVL